MIRVAPWLLLAGTWVVSRAEAQEAITILGRTEIEGTVRSVVSGMIEVTDNQGQTIKFKIQDKDQQGVPLGGAKVLYECPATVEVTGTMPVDSLTPGTLVRFSAKVNRQGRTEGTVDKILLFDEKKYPLGVEVDKGTEERGFATCTISGEFTALRNNRLQVTFPKSDYVRASKLSCRLAENVAVTIESADYKRAKPGDQVTRLRALKFSTGDTVITELAIRLASRTAPAKERGKRPADDLSKYRLLSDAPSPPRDASSAHFLVHTDLSERNLRMLLDKLETMLTLVSQYYGRNPARVIECYVVRDLQQWAPGTLPAEAVAKIREPAGVTLSLTVGQVTKSVVYSCDKPEVVQHECIHAYCTEAFGSSGPTWYAEGMAEMGAYWKKDQRAVDVDPVVIDYLKRGPAQRLPDIIAAEQITGDSWQAYAWRWAVCHLLATNPNYAGRFRALGLALMARQPGASFDSAYGPMAKEISFEYDEFCKHVDNGYRSDLCAWQWNRKSLALLRVDGPVATGVLARSGWQAGGIRLKAGTSYDYAAKGTWKLAEGAEAVDADGQADGTGRLIGVLFRDFRLGEPFELGVKGTLVAPHDGDLYLRCRDSWTALGDNDGTVTAYFRRTP